MTDLVIFPNWIVTSCWDKKLEFDEKCIWKFRFCNVLRAPDDLDCSYRRVYVRARRFYVLNFSHVLNFWCLLNLIICKKYRNIVVIICFSLFLLFGCWNVWCSDGFNLQIYFSFEKSHSWYFEFDNNYFIPSIFVFCLFGVCPFY